ncbi:hypothetical protein GHT06_012577 [Daphnia sinensis]|uniref:Uncharacterized protein n=1 Tax=Daphnia sinensis TaxID=1820382 RepID=A0AAD5PW97_9CRUS|nr:hypothetical protein GHT06_012577 [Daphnia sinensis]
MKGCVSLFVFAVFVICCSTLTKAANLITKPNINMADLNGAESIPYGKIPSRHRGYPYGTRYTHYRVTG